MDIKKTLEDFLKRTHPDRRGLQISNLEEINDGWETDIFSFTHTYGRGGQVIDEDLVIRFFLGPSHMEQAMKEFIVMKQVQKFGVPVPRVDLLVTEGSPFKQAFIVMEKIQGDTLLAVLSNATKMELFSYLRLAVGHLVRLHQIPWSEIFEVGPGMVFDPDSPLTFVQDKLTAMHRTIERYKLDEFEPCMQWLQERSRLGTKTRMCVIHNDYHPQNILVQDDEPGMAIIDWSFAAIGDYRLDLAWSVLLFGVMLGEAYREFIVKTYEDISGSQVEHFEYFEALKFTERMLTIATWLDESVEIPVAKITRNAIRNDYKIHVLNVYKRLKQITGLELPVIETL